MIHPPRLLRTVVGAVSAICYLATQCAFAYQPEKNFWAQRRKSAQGLTLTRNGSVKVFESSGLFPPGAVSSLSQLSSPVWSKTVRAGFLKHHRDLFVALPPSAGSVRKVALPKPGSPPGPVIVHIQDVHMNQDAQKNIGAVVGSLMKAGRVNLVALEGSTEEINLQPFADSPHRKAAEMTADYLLQENKISGPIHAAITHAGPLPRILGVDDPAHYQANVQAYLDSVPQREKAQQEWKSLQLEIDNQKRTVYSPELAVFDNAVTRYRDGKISLGEYVELLNKTSGPSSSRLGWESVADFLKAFRIERSLDFKKVELERSQLIEKLTQSLTKAESDELVAHGVAHRSGQLRYGEFYSYLVKLCGKKGIRLTAYPAMDAYVRYLLVADGIDAERLMEEMADLEKEGYALLAKTTEEKDLAARARRAWLTSKLLDFSLIPTEWKEYQSGPRSESLWAFEAFYEQAQARDKAMADNVLRAMGPSSTTGQVVLLVTGGFHAAGMTDLLTQRGATVVSLVPKIEKIDTAHGAAYLSVFTQEKSPLEKLAQGEKLFLAANPLTPSLKSTLLPALFAMVVIGLGGTALGLDVNVIFNTMGGVGVLALIQRMGNKVKARLKIGKSAINLDLRNDSNSIQSFYQTPSHILASDRWIILLGAGLFVAGVFLLGASGFNGLTVVGVLSAGISFYQVKNPKGDVLSPLTGYLPTLTPDELKALRWLVSQRLRESSYFDMETITEIVNKAKLLASDASIRLNAQMGLPEIGGKIQIYSKNGLSEVGLHKIFAKFGYPIIDHYLEGQTVQTILLPLALTANEAARIASEVLLSLKSEWPDLIVEHQITLGGTYPETVRYLALLHWMTGRHIFKPTQNPFHYPGDAPGIVIKGADVEQASPFHPERKHGERVDVRGRAFVLSSVNDDVLRKDLEADLAFIQLGGLAATKSEIPSAERKEWEKSLAGLFKKLVKQINQAVGELSPLAGERLIGDKSWVADKNKSTWDQTVFPALKDLADRLTSEREAEDGHLSRRWLINAKMRFIDEASSVVKTEEAIDVARGTYNKAGNSGRATGWISVISSTILGFLGFSPDFAEAAVRTGQIVSHESIAAVLFSVVAYLVTQVVSLMRLNNSSTRPLQPTDAKALDVEAPPLDNPAPSIEDRADEETRNAFHRFAVGVGIDPITARFAPLRVVKGKAGHFERAIFAGGRRFVGEAVVNPVNDPNVVRARIVAAPMSHPSSENKSQEADLPTPVAPVRSVELHEKGMVVDEPNETAMPLEDLLGVGFNDYAVTNNMDRGGARFSKARSVTENQLSQAVHVGARRFIVEALRHYYFSDGKVRSRTEVSVLEDPLYKKWMAERLMKENEERTRARLNVWLPPLNSVRPNNILFLLTGKRPAAGFVIDAVFLLGAAASGAMMGVLLPAFALLHVALEHRKDPGLGVKAGFFSFVVHLVFMLPYAFLDFSGGFYLVGAWAWAVAAVGVHGAYDAFAIGLSDGRDVAKLTRGSFSDRMEVLLGRVVSVSESFKGEVLSMSPDLFRRLSNEKKGPLYKIGVKIGAAQYKGRSDLVPVIEMPVFNEEELQSLLSLVEKVRNLNQSNPDQQRFITVTPQGKMTAERVNQALFHHNTGTFMFVKNLTGPITFSDYEREFGSALTQFGLDPKNMFLILAGRPDIGDLESIKSGDPRDSELRKALREVLFAPWPVVSTAVIMEMLNAISVAGKNA